MRDKAEAFDTYARFDLVAVGQPGWSSRTYRRWDPGDAWAGTDGDGRSHAFCVRGGPVLGWRQRAPGGSWRAPVDIGGAALAATLAVGANADGRLEVFAKNSGGGISTAYQTEPNGAFSPWVDFGGGPDVQGVPAVVTRPDGRMALFATTSTGVLWWSQDALNAGWSGPVALVDAAVTGPPTAALNDDGRAEVFYRADEGAASTVYVTRSGTWSAPPTGLGGDGTGPVAAPLARGLILLLGRDAGGRVTACRQRARPIRGSPAGPTPGCSPRGHRR
ncbi:hypothetical protein ALI22I_20695 [Saccharothrix sp. ALI-22-I]|uniref:hypothetical protein n=1 Tax=Saccharothrix sp. ALI-22-I TaxID=1933778 RepID=UPI00097C729A|nr:hypothetical protein [Saccharothrix sp. ALI-22-I]ONI87644.1 hypothetical protein ALI22I_20695 [Saccharothrix sp. ALI-22-I]